MKRAARSPFRRSQCHARQRGLSTVEYTVVLVLIAVVGIAAWQVFGQKVERALGMVNQELAILDGGGAESGLPDPSGPGSNGSSGPGANPTAGGSVPGPANPAGAGKGGTGKGAPAPAPSTTGLGADVDKVVAQSAQLQKQVQGLKKNGWTIQYGQPGKGTFTKQPHDIVIDPSAKTDPKLTAQLLSHEVGHAENPARTVPTSGLTREQFVQQSAQANLLGEASAVLNNMETREQVLAGGGADIGINGTQDAKYESIYKDYKAGKITRDQAKQQIAQTWGANETTSNTKQNYQTYYETEYGKIWDKQFPGKPKGYVAP